MLTLNRMLFLLVATLAFPGALRAANNPADLPLDLARCLQEQTRAVDRIQSDLARAQMDLDSLVGYNAMAEYQIRDGVAAQAFVARNRFRTNVVDLTLVLENRQIAALREWSQRYGDRQASNLTSGILAVMASRYADRASYHGRILFERLRTSESDSVSDLGRDPELLPFIDAYKKSRYGISVPRTLVTKLDGIVSELNEQYPQAEPVTRAKLLREMVRYVLESVKLISESSSGTPATR